MNHQIVTLTQNNEAVTTSLAIAEGTDNEHKAVIQLVRNYQSDLEDFGPLTFEMAKGKALPQGGFAKSTEYAILNEDQATLLITYMRNSEVVRTFKKRLVKEFRSMHNALQQTQLPQTYTQALEQLLIEVKAKEQLQIENQQQATKIQQDQPKVDYVNDLIETDERLSVRNVAKSLHLKETEFRNWLVWAGELLDAGKYTANRYSISADAARNRRMDLKRSKPHTAKDGEVFQAITPYFTDLGVIHIKTRLKNYKTKYPEKYAVSFKDSIEDAKRAQAKEAKLQEFSVI